MRPVAHCKPTGLPLLNTLPLPFKLVQTPDLVADALRGKHACSGRSFSTAASLSRILCLRHSAIRRAAGKDDELVVDTRGFSDRHWLDAMGHPLTEQLHLIERFRRPDAGHLEIETTIDDPGAYTKPFTYTVKLTLMPDDELLEYFCTDNEKDSQHYQ